MSVPGSAERANRERAQKNLAAFSRPRRTRVCGTADCECLSAMDVVSGESRENAKHTSKQQVQDTGWRWGPEEKGRGGKLDTV
eukprot:3662986-Rhodomonas_salina.1